MRIGIDLTSIWRPSTGNELLAIEMTRALLRVDRQNDYVLFFAKRSHSELEEFAERFEAILAPWRHEVLVKHMWLHRTAAAAKLDYMHFPAFPPPWYLPCPSGWTLPDATPWLYPETMKLKSRWYYQVLGGRAVRTNCLLITDTEASREDLLREVGVPPARLHVIYPGLRSIFQRCQDSAEFERVRRCYDLPESFILFVGTIEPRKNLLRILSAFRMLRAHRDFRPALVIVGRKGWLYSPIFDELASEGLTQHVRLTGHVSDRDLVTLYNMARLLVFPSLYEGFGSPGIEAMACGCPVVTSNRGAQYEVTGNAALHVNPEDVSEIADAIWRVQNDETLREQLIARGFQRAASFSWDHYAHEFLSILGHVIAGTSGNLISEQCST